MEENELNTETAQPFVKEWLDNGAEISEGFRLYLENGEWNPKIYARMVKYCRQNGYEILDKRPEYFEIVEPKKPTQEELDAENANRVRSIRGEYMAETLNKVERYETQKAAEIETTESAETYRNYLLYLQYLRDVPQSVDFPNIEVLTFDEWSVTLIEKINTSEGS